MAMLSGCICCQHAQKHGFTSRQVGEVKRDQAGVDDGGSCPLHRNDGGIPSGRQQDVNNTELKVGAKACRPLPGQRLAFVRGRRCELFRALTLGCLGCFGSSIF
jgi:hypothetical protein